MKNDSVRRFVELRNSLQREKRDLEQRLRQLNEALEEETGAAPSPASAPQAQEPRPVGPGRKPSGGLSLREAVLQVTAQHALTKQEILEAINKLGYRFSTSNPLNSLGVILYGKNPRFKNEDGRFSPLGGRGGSQRKVGARNDGVSKKRQLSPEARERIAAAQRARWAKVRGR